MSPSGSALGVEAAGLTGEAITVRIDGTQPMSMESVRVIESGCNAAEDLDGPGIVYVHLSGAPQNLRPSSLDVGLVTKWERTLRRLERLPMLTVAVASGACGGSAMDVLLATDYRIADPDLRLVIPAEGDLTWPGMTLYRLAQQVGIARIRRVLLFGVAIESNEALELHLIDKVVDAPDSAAASAALTQRAWKISGPELAIRRQLMFEAGSRSFEDALGAHLAACDRTIRRATVEPAS